MATVDPLSEFAVTESTISIKHVEMLERLLENAEAARDVPAFLAANPVILAQWQGAGRDRWIIPRGRLGPLAIDFMLGDKPDAVFAWTAVVLAAPDAELADPGALDGLFARAVQPTLDGRAWMAANLDAARRARSEGGIGLVDAAVQVPGLVFLGRRRDWSADATERCERIGREHGDHFAGLPFMLLDAQLVSRRTKPLTIVGPKTTTKRLTETMECLFPGSTGIAWRFSLENEEFEEGIAWSKGPVTAMPYRVKHYCGAPPTCSSRKPTTGTRR